MSTPTVISRIQNRRGTQAQFNALYPNSYTSLPGATSSGTTITVTSTAGLYVYAIPTITAGIGEFAPGTYVESIIDGTTFTVNLAPLTPLSGGATVIYVEDYEGIGGCSISEFPNILMPGELALCTDSRRLFIGNVNGEYVELSTYDTTGNLALLPFVKQLPPSSVYTDIVGLEYETTPFMTFLYDVTDSLNPDWNTEGIEFSRNGEMKVTAINISTTLPPDPPAPFPANSHVTLTDDGTDVCVDDTLFISFKAIYIDSGTKIQIQYKHNYPDDLMFSTGTIIWLPFA